MRREEEDLRLAFLSPSVSFFFTVFLAVKTLRFPIACWRRGVGEAAETERGFARITVGDAGLFL